MIVAVMQPYFLPYLGYFQLLRAVDALVLLDDVHYINRGWINRNRIAVAGEPHWLTIPLVGASQNRLIHEIDVMPDDGWKRRIVRTVQGAYARAPEFGVIEPIFEAIVDDATGDLSSFLFRTLSRVAAHVGIETEIIPSSRVFPKGELRGEGRILDICRRLNASRYVNLPGGRDLYSASTFASAGIELSFIESSSALEQQPHGGIAGVTLSILDLMMFNRRWQLEDAMRAFRLAPASGSTLESAP